MPEILAPGPISRTHLPSDGAITALIDEVFEPATATSTKVHWGNVVTALEAGDAADARDKLLKVAEFIQSHTQLIKPPPGETREQVATRLVDLMVAYAFGSAGMGSDAVIALIKPAKRAVIRTPGRRAAIDLPARSFSQPTVLLIYRDPVQDRTKCAGPLVTTLCQYPLFYHFEPYPYTRLNVPARVGVCVVNEGQGALPDSIHHRVRLAHDRPANSAGYVPGSIVRDSIEILPLVDISDFLLCGTTTLASAVSTAPVGNSLADRGLHFLNRLASAAAAFVSPTTAHAIDQGGGGLMLEFSNFNVVDPDDEVENPPADVTPPAVTPNVTGTLSGTGWYTSDVEISWNVTDSESTVTSSACAGSSVTSDTPGQTFTCTATSAGGTTTGSVTIMRDASPPVISPTVSGTLGNNSWYTGDVAIAWSVTDPTSGVSSSSGCDTSSVVLDTPGVTFTCSAVNGAGLPNSNTSFVKRDATKPVVGYAGNAGSYTVDQTVEIVCAASDAMSGLAINTCGNIGGQAYTFIIGTNTASATATDNAGNSNSASTTFEVQVTPTSLCTLTLSFTSSVTIGNSLCAKLSEYDASIARGNLASAAEQRAAYINEVEAQSGKTFTADEADTLIALALAL